jgi:methylmalonyl-CoA mutase
MATESILSEFQPVSTEEWERIIREDLKGADYAAKLIWHPEEGFAVRPYYRAEDLVGMRLLDAAPGEFPYVRGTRATGDWRIREEVDAVDPEEANHTACAAVISGAEEIAFRCARIESTSDVALLLANLREIPIHFGDINRQSICLLLARLNKRPHGAGLSAGIDPLEDPDFAAELLHNAPTGLRLFTIRADEFLERGAGAVEEIGFSLAAAVDFTAEMQDRKLPLKQIAESISFSFAMGPDLFIQIAKLRAFRMLWAQAVEAFGGMHADAKAVIHAHTCNWNKTVYDPDVNILRATTEAISAILGGADSISIAPFNRCYREPDENSRRLARNTQLVLKHEAFLSRVADPVGGSYLIEVLTGSIAAKAWKAFQEIEAAGGHRKAKAAGVVESVLEQRTKSREQAVASRRLVLTGTTRYADAAERAMERIEAGCMNSALRAAQSFEKLRLRTERHARSTGREPRILLAEIGDTKMRSARSQFAADFLACAGFSSSTQIYEHAEQIAASGADVIVLCSSDAEYFEIARELFPALKDRGNRSIVVVAGNPESAGRLREVGIANFIHMRSNAVEVLAELQGQIGMRN